MSTKITEHFTLEEFACKDGTPYPVDNVDVVDGETWLRGRLAPLCATLEAIRARLSDDERQEVSLRVVSGYRSPSYNGALAGAARRSQHVQGRAADVKAFTRAGRQVSVTRVWQTIRNMEASGALPHLGGLGRYPTFTHVDVRPRSEDDHLAQWDGTRTEN